MKLQELANKAAGIINSGGDTIQLVMPQRKTEYEHYYLAGRKSPKGKRINFCKNGEIVNFDALDVLAWCIAHGAKGVFISPDGEEKTSDELLAEIKHQQPGT